MDTWTAQNGKMWFRDFLPMETSYFRKSRIMTFGYDSDLKGRDSVMELDDWAGTLLNDICASRELEEVSYTASRCYLFLIRRRKSVGRFCLSVTH